LVLPIADDVLSLRSFDTSDTLPLLAGRDPDFYEWLGEGSSEPAACIWVAEAIVGWIDYDQNRSWLATAEVNVGYNVFPNYRCNGYATRALRLFTSYLSELDPPLVATLLINPANGASLTVAERAGFREVAKLDDQVFLKCP
jgi:RimJ/RimL family protein N-acetyltransferase